MASNQYTEDIAHIRSMMERSSRFISLSGWAGILPGIFALSGLALALWFIKNSNTEEFPDHGIDNTSPLAIQLVLTALVVLALSVFSSWYTSMRKAKAEHQSTWSPAIQNMLIYFSIPLIAGAVVVAWVYIKEDWGLMAPVILSFYGLALIQASHFTLKSVLWLGLIEIALALLSGIPGWGIPILAIGFGFTHIIYGMLQFTPKASKNNLA
jgi:magnesium-transporting ATPase (P-type)